jgi:hypothetical protein
MATQDDAATAPPAISGVDYYHETSDWALIARVTGLASLRAPYPAPNAPPTDVERWLERNGVHLFGELRTRRQRYVLTLPAGGGQGQQRHRVHVDIDSVDLQYVRARYSEANWTPDSLIGRMFKVLGRYVPPPAGVQPPSLWGTEEHIRTLFGEAAAAVQITPRHFAFRYRSAAHFVEVFRTWYGPVNKAFAAQTPEKADALAAELAPTVVEAFEAGAVGDLFRRAVAETDEAELEAGAARSGIDAAFGSIVLAAVDAGAFEIDRRRDAVDFDQVGTEPDDAAAGREPELAVVAFPAGRVIAAHALAAGQAVGAVEAEPVKRLVAIGDARQQFTAAGAQDAAERAEPEVTAAVVEDAGEAEIGQAVIGGEAVPLFAVPEEESAAEGGDPQFVAGDGQDAGDPVMLEQGRIA